MKAGLAACLLACREAAGLGLRGDVVVAAVADEEHASLGVQEVLVGRAARTRRSSPSRPSCRSSSPTRASCGRRSRCNGVAAHGSRPHLGVDAIAAAGPVLTRLGELDAALGASDASAAGPRLGPRVADLRRRGALELPGALRAVARAADAAGGDRRRRRGRGRGADRRRGRARSARCSCASRSRSTPTAEIVSLVRSAAGGAPVTGASYWADAAFIAAAGIPTVMYGPGGEGAHAADGVGQRRPTRSRSRGRWSTVAARALRMRALVNPAYDPAAVPGAVGRGAGVPSRPRRLPRRRRCATSATASGSRTSPTGSGCRRSRCSARRGRSSGRCARTRRSTRWSPPARATTGAPSRTSPRCAGCAAASSCRRARPPRRREAIAGEGAEVVMVDGTYEEAVARARGAKAPGRAASSSPTSAPPAPRAG